MMDLANQVNGEIGIAKHKFRLHKSLKLGYSSPIPLRLNNDSLFNLYEDILSARACLYSQAVTVDPHGCIKIKL